MDKIVTIPEPKQPLPEPKPDTGLLQWFSTVDHKQLGILYLFLALVFFIIGGSEALLMRYQLIQPRNNFLNPEIYNQIFTMHGTTMIFLVLMPAFFGFGTYFLPLMIGANDLAFPRLNAFSFWITCLGGLLLYFSFFAGGAPDTGWFNYAPLNERQYATSQGVDYYSIGLLLTGMGSIGAALNFIVTTLTMRAKNMRLTQLPLFVWMVFINAFLILGALPALNGALCMLLVDRQLYGHFFTDTNGGSAVLWQHLFWAFGHPEVYILILPGFGILSEVIPVFSRKPIFGYEFVAASTVAITLLSFLVWVHHMFAVGLANVITNIFSATSLLIAVPTGIKVISWISTMYKGSLHFTVSMMFATAFLVQFTIGGLSGVGFAMVPIDWELTDSYFVVAHLHYVFLGGTLFSVLAGLFYWFPKMSGRMLDETLGRWVFWLFVLGFNMTFLIQHALGILGMPRRVYTYPDLPYYALFNLISTIGAFLMGLASMILLYNIFHSLKKGKQAPSDPWDAFTLEWMTPSPPRLKNFDTVPEVRSRRPFWDFKYPDEADWKRKD